MRTPRGYRVRFLDSFCPRCGALKGSTSTQESVPQEAPPHKGNKPTEPCPPGDGTEKIVILGGGVGGAIAAIELSKRLKGQAEITLVDREGKHHFPPSYPWLLMGWRTPDQLVRPLSRLRARDVRLRTEEVSAIDPDERLVTAGSEVIAYDHLLIALGAELDPAAVDGYAEAAHHPYDLEGAIRLREALRGFKGGRVLVGVSRMPFKCPAAPYETAFLMDYYFRMKGMRDRVEMEFFTPEPYPVPAAGPAIGESVGRMMEERGIPLHAKREVDHIDAESRTVHFKGDAQLGYDLLVAVPPHTTCEAVRSSDLTKDGPWIPVDRYTLRTSYDDVYAVGDVTSIKTPSANVPMLPKAGVFAERQAKVAVENIVADVSGGDGARWDGYGICFLEIGYGMAGMVRGNFYGEEGPSIKMRRPRRLWHWGKALVERRWLGKLFR
jgi:sulfide:quinone oxidoreductase